MRRPRVEPRRRREDRASREEEGSQIEEDDISRTGLGKGGDRQEQDNGQTIYSFVPRGDDRFAGLLGMGDDGGELENRNRRRSSGNRNNAGCREHTHPTNHTSRREWPKTTIRESVALEKRLDDTVERKGGGEGTVEKGRERARYA